MNNSRLPPEMSWRRSRYGFAVLHLVILLLAWLIFRIVLFAAFKPVSTGFNAACLAFLAGFQRDLLVALVMTVPLLGWMLVAPNRWRNSAWHRRLFWTAYFLFWFILVFFLFVEFFFFEEFKSRFNTVAVDYIWYPHEVFINIWESYHVGIIAAVCFFVSLALIACLSRFFRRMWEQPFTGLNRLLYLVGALAIIVLLSFTLNLKSAHVGSERTLNEVANNGLLAFASAAWTRHLDYPSFYKTMEPDEAYARARRLLEERDTEFMENGRSIRRKVAGEQARPRLNVVIFLEESLGSEFWGCLGRPSTLTPEMDRLAIDEGLLFTNIYASGNRTVRGFEGVLSSFPPLPGDSIVKRDLSSNVETIARVLKRDNYATVFLYGGRGLFDGMRSFAVRNGYDRFIEQKHFAHPNFTTIWGVSDEELFARALEEMRIMAKGEKPFLATVLSVSNHKPYTYPKGRIPEDPEKRKREHAVKYSDFALGQFFRGAKKESFWTNTIFVVVADHGARVYGKQSIPIHSYEIPLVILGPAVVKTPQRLPQLGCSLDVAPTVLGLLGRPYESLFFGRDLFKSIPGEGRSLLNHNRDIGMLAHDRMVVLGLMKTVEFYGGNPKVVDMSPLTDRGDGENELEKDAIAMFQVADDLYTHERYRIDGNAAQSFKPGNARVLSTAPRATGSN